MPGGGSKPGERRGGRKPGTPNKSTIRPAEIVLKRVAKATGERWDPLEFHIRVAMGIEGQPSTSERLTAADKVLRRLYPEIRAVEVSGQDGGAIPVVISKAIAKL